MRLLLAIFLVASGFPTNDVICADFATDEFYCDRGENDGLHCGDCDAIPKNCVTEKGQKPDDDSTFCYAASDRFEGCRNCARMEVEDEEGNISAIFIEFVHYDGSLVDTIEVDVNAYNSLGILECNDTPLSDTVRVYPVLCPFQVICADFATAEAYCDKEENGLDCVDCDAIPQHCVTEKGQKPDDDSTFCYAASDRFEDCGNCARMEVEDEEGNISAVFIEFVHYDETLTRTVEVDVSAYDALGILECNDSPLSDTVRLYPVDCEPATTSPASSSTPPDEGDCLPDEVLSGGICVTQCDNAENPSACHGACTVDEVCKDIGSLGCSCVVECDITRNPDACSGECDPTMCEESLQSATCVCVPDCEGDLSVKCGDCGVNDCILDSSKTACVCGDTKDEPSSGSVVVVKLLVSTLPLMTIF